MKLFCVILLLITNSFLVSLKAQNWSPVSVGKTYHYSCDTTNTIFSLWADSLHVNGQDTTYYLNRLILPCDTCNWPYYQNYFGSTNVTLMIRNQPFFLKRELKVLNNGIFVMISPDTLVFDKNVAVSNSWIFDSFPNTQATVIFKNYGDVLGVPDSLMGVVINTNDTIILSKNYGIVKWPCIPGNYFRLMGVEGNDTVGYSVPDSSDIYDFHIGDSFYYEDWQLWPDRDYNNQICVKIDSLYYSGITKKYRCQFYEMGHLNDYGWNIHTWWDNGDTSNCDILIHNCIGINSEFSLENFPIEYCRSHQDTMLCPMNISTPYYSVFKLYFDNNRTVFEQLPLKYISLSDNYGFPSVFSDILINNDIMDIHHILIKEKQGLIENRNHLGSIDAISWGRVVSVQVINGDTISVPNLICSYLNINNPNNKSSLIIFPNPTNGEFNITGIDNGVIEVYSLVGEKVYSEKIENGSSETTSTIHLPKGICSGMYIVKIISGEEQFSSKLLLK